MPGPLPLMQIVAAVQVSQKSSLGRLQGKQRQSTRQAGRELCFRTPFPFARPFELYGVSWQNHPLDPQILNTVVGVTLDPESGFGLRVQDWMRCLVRTEAESSVEECF